MVCVLSIGEWFLDVSMMRDFIFGTASPPGPLHTFLLLLQAEALGADHVEVQVSHHISYTVSCCPQAPPEAGKER